MKRAKMMLTALVVLGVVSGAMAFKAKKFQDGSLYTFNPDEQACNLVGPVHIIPGGQFTATDATVILGGSSPTTDPANCTESFTYNFEN